MLLHRYVNNVTHPKNCCSKQNQNDSRYELKEPKRINFNDGRLGAKQSVKGYNLAAVGIFFLAH